MSRVLVLSSANNKDQWFEVYDLLATSEFKEFINEKIKLTTTLAKTKRGRQRTFQPDTRLASLYSFVHDCVDIIHKDVKLNDPIIGQSDIYPFLKKKYRVTIEELK